MTCNQTSNHTTITTRLHRTAGRSRGGGDAWRATAGRRNGEERHGCGIAGQRMAGAWRGCDWLRHRSGLIGVAPQWHGTAMVGGGSEEQGKGKACERMASDSDGKAGMVR